MALRVLQIGALASVLVVAPHFAFELDRFYVPKELVLHLTAALAALLMGRRATTLIPTRVDRCLVVFLLAGVVSALLAPNGWNAVRALAISLSGVAVFWSARALREVGLAGPLVAGLALAVVAAAFTALLQAYGLSTDFFSTNRAPGGTLGNRNAVGHLVALGFPLLALAAVETRRASRFGLWSLAALLCVAALVLTRSRAAWLAFAVVLVLLLAGLLVVALRHRTGRVPARFVLLLGTMALGAGAALWLPNALQWRSNDPYRETARSVTNYREGSGRGRLIQYQRSLVMVLHNPVWGVGPGNWPVVYPAHAARRDPSMSGRHQGRTSNPWPSSDVVAFVSERGFVGFLPFALALLLLAGRSLRALWQRANRQEALHACALLALLAGTLVCGLFDAVLLLAWPTLIVFAAAGALWPATSPPAPDEAVAPSPVPALPAAPPVPPASPAPRTRAWQPALALLVLAAVSGGAAFLSASQVAAMALFSGSPDRATLEKAAALDPGNYRIRLRLAQRGPRASRCEHARAAHVLYPHDATAERLARRCR